MLQKIHPIFGSSQNPNELAMTVKGILLGLIPLAVIVFTSVGVDITSGELVEIVNAIMATVASILTVWGLIRKFKK